MVRQILAGAVVVAVAGVAGTAGSVAQEAPSAREVQELLAARSCDPGPIDGQWGKRSARALGVLQRKAGTAFAYPMSADQFSALEESDVGCVEPLYDVAQMRINAKANRTYCDFGTWNTPWLGPKWEAQSTPTVELIGDDLAFYRPSTNPFVALLLRENVTALQYDDSAELKPLFMNAVENDHFSELVPYRPKTWEGKKPYWLPSYPPYADPAYYAAVLLIAAAQSFAILEADLSEQEIEAVRTWGGKIARLVMKYSGDGHDGRAASAAGLTHWGAVADDREVYDAGAKWFRAGVADIRRDGREGYFTQGRDGHRGLELKYQQSTYGFLSLAAYAVERSGGEGFTYRRGGGSLLDGINYHLDRGFFPENRTRITAKQVDVDYFKQPRNTAERSLAFIEYARALGYGEESVPLLPTALQKVRSFRGFYGGDHGGFTSCLLSLPDPS